MLNIELLTEKNFTPFSLDSFKRTQTVKKVYRRQNGKYALVRFELETGRKNQIRVACKSLGCPLVGDKKYGANKNPIGRLGLHNYYLKFNHPITNAQIELTTKVPKEFAEIFEIKKISS